MLPVLAVRHQAHAQSRARLQAIPDGMGNLLTRGAFFGFL